jgi:hypothetical protein
MSDTGTGPDEILCVECETETIDCTCCQHCEGCCEFNECTCCGREEYIHIED